MSLHPYLCGKVEMTMIEISFAEIFQKAQDLSSYEGRTLRDENGDSLYPSVHLTEQDEPIVIGYVAHGLPQIASALRIAVTSAVQGADGGALISLVTDRTLNTGACSKPSFIEMLAAYVMYMWLQDKDATRSEAYKLIFGNMVDAVKSTISRKRPTL